MKRTRAAELGVLGALLAAQAVLFAQPISSATTYDEGVYLAAVDALRHGQELGRAVFAAQFPGFYDLLRGLSFVTGISVTGMRAGLLAVLVAGTIGGWLVGRRVGGTVGGLLVAAFLVIAPPLDLFGYQVIADTPALGLMVLALGLATLAGPVAALAAGGVLALALSVKLTAITVVPALAWFLRDRLLNAAVACGVVVTVLLAFHADALGSLWSSGVTYHSQARSTPAVIPHPDRQILDQIPRTTPFFVLACLAIVVEVAFLILRRRLEVWPLWSWVVLGVGFLLVHQPLHYNHLVLVPFALAVAAGGTLGAAVETLPSRYARLAAVALAAAVAAGYVQQWHRVDLQRALKEPSTNVAAAHALAQLVPAYARTVDDRPIISFLAHRRVVGPLVDLALLRFKTGSLTDDAVIRDLAAARAVVVSRTLRTRPRVLRYVHAQFDRRYDRGGVAIWVRR